MSYFVGVRILVSAAFILAAGVARADEVHPCPKPVAAECPKPVGILPLKIALLTPSPGSPFVSQVIKAAKDLALVAKAPLTVATASDPASMSAEFRRLLYIDRPNAIVVMPSPPNPALVAVAREARQRGVLVLALREALDPEVVDATIMVDYSAAEHLLAQWAGAVLGTRMRTARVGFIDRAENFSPDRIGDDAFVSALPKRDIAENDVRAAADQGFSRVVAKMDHVDLVHVFADNELGNIAQQLRSGAVIVALGGSCAGLQALQAGRLLGAIVQEDPSLLIQWAFHLLSEHHQRGKMPQPANGRPFFDVGVRLVTDRPVSDPASITSGQAMKWCW